MRGRDSRNEKTRKKDYTNWKLSEMSCGQKLPAKNRIVVHSLQFLPNFPVVMQGRNYEIAVICRSYEVFVPAEIFVAILQHFFSPIVKNSGSSICNLKSSNTQFNYVLCLPGISLLTLIIPSWASLDVQENTDVNCTSKLTV